MNNDENYSNDNIDQLGKIGNQNMEAKTEYKKLKSTKSLSEKDKHILGLVAAGRPMDRICAMHMVHKSYVQALVEKNKQ